MKNYFIKIFKDGLSYYLTTKRNWSEYYFDNHSDESCLFESYTLHEMKKIVVEESEINRATYEIYKLNDEKK